jgi:heat shock protein HtpX
MKLEHYKHGLVNHAAEAHPASAHLFIVNPLSGARMDNLFSTHPSTENRVAALQALVAEMAPARPAGRGGRPPGGGPWGGGRRNPWG